METLGQYTIYCTHEQTKKAFELGAPIKILYPYESIDAQFSDKCVVLKHGYVDSTNRTTYTLLIGPTAEQMIGFILDSGRGYAIDLAELIKECGYKQGCLTFIENSLK